MACLVQNGTTSNAHLPVHENLSKKRKLASPNHFKNKRVQRIHDTSTSPPWTPLYPGSRLEQEAIQYIHKFYCKDCQMDQQAAERAKAAAASGEDNSASGTAEASAPQQPPVLVPEVKQEPASPMSPQQMTDEASLMITLDKNKESLKRKLMMRRSLNELVDQGIYPPPKTPPAFMEQRKSLERAKIGDSLRFKISHRPDRQQLVQQHILEDTTIDPSLHERQRLLKKARLADSLNDKLLHRPGVLELVQGNIIQTDGKLTQLIKEGSLSFDTAVEGECSNDSNYDEGKSSDEAFSPDQTDDSNLSDVSSPPVIPPAPELPTSFAKSLPFSAQIQFHQDSKVTLPLTTQSFTIPHQTTSSGGFGATATFMSPRNNVTVSTINNNNYNKSRPKKAKPKPQPKAKVIKFHEYKGPPNVVKSSQPVSSPPAAIAGTIGNTTNIIGQQSQQAASDTPYHILLQQQQLFLQWQLEFNQKNLNGTTVLVPAHKDGQTGLHTITSSLGSSTGTSVTESVAVSVNTQTNPQTVFTVTPTSQHAQPQAQLQQIRISSPVMTQIKQEPQLGQPQPQMNPNVTPVTPKPPVKKPTVNITAGPPKQYTTLEEMKVAELKAELKKRNLTVSGPKPQLIERLKPYADAILKCPSDKSPSSVQSPGSSILSPSGSIISSKSAQSPQSYSVMSPLGSVTSPQGSVIPSKTVVISAPGSSSSVGTAMTLPVVVSTFSGAFSQPGSVQSSVGSLTSPGSVASSTGSVTSPAVPNSSQSGSVFSRPGSVMSPLGSVIDETLCNNADSPLASIQSMQSAVSVSNMMFPADDLSNPFSPPQSPLFMDNVMTPLSPDLMDIHVQSPGDLRAVKHQTGFQMNNTNLDQQNQNNAVQNNMEQSRPPSVLSLAPSETERHDMAMDIDLDLSQSLSTGLAPTLAAVSAATQATAPPPPPLPNFPTNQSNLIKAQQDDQQQMLNQIQAQLRILQEKQKQNQKKQLQMQQASASGYQMSQEELLKQQQEKIEKLQSQLEESQLRLQLQQLQHQQLQTQQQQLQQLQQQALQQQAAQNQLEQQHQQMQQNMQQQHVAAQQNIQVPASQQQQHQSSILSPQSPQQVAVQKLQTAVQGQPNVSVPSQAHCQQQMPMQGQPQVQLQGQPQTAVQGQPPLAVQVPRSSPIIVQSQTSVAQTQPSMVQTQSQQKSPQHTTQKQVPTTSAQVIFSVPTIPNGSKAPTLANLPPNMKQIQIPAHLLHAFQNSQGVPAVIVTQNPKTTAKKTKAPNLEFIKNQAINQTLNLGGGRSLIAVSTATGGTQQFIIATAPTAPKTSTNAPQTSTPAPTLNGLSQPTVQKMATSLPTSPVEGNQRPVARTSSNPYFIPMKEPPKYDEVVKNKQNKGSEGGNDNVEKSQTMDDVLEILIRTGELPASAAQEPPPTPKTTSQSPTVPTISVSQSTMVSIPNTQFQNQSVVFSTPTHNVSTVSPSPNSQYSEMKGNIDSVYVPMEGLISASASSCGIKTEVKLEPCETNTCRTLNAPDVIAPDMSVNSHDFFDLSDVINNDLNAMDWTPDPTFGDLDLTDMTNTSSAMDLIPNDQSFLSIPNVQSPQRSIHGSEPDLANLGLTDMDTNCNMQIDVPDWLDVIMPNTGLTPLSANAPVSFPADPILTPQTQKEVLDLFNFDESDLNTPSDLNCASAWDKLTETTSH